MNQLHEMYLAAAVDARRASLVQEARAERAARAARPAVGQRARARRWRMLLPHLRLNASEARLSPATNPI